MDGLTASELSMIHKLAGNDVVARRKTIKKLKIWLGAISKKIPDTPECRELVENNFLRVWKALFYCMWMADKPLPQEQLAEQISNLVEIFASKPHVLHLFVEWFFRSMAREWPHIDRFRLDKFMMLTRRFLRKTLMVMSERKWKLDILDGFLKIVTSNIFNRRPEIKNTRAKARDPAIEIAPLGMQLHVIDIFLEELAKTSGDSLKSQKIVKILTPFVNELAYADDDRLLGDIEERIFRHLMRQSDAGIDYAEGVQPGDDDDEDEGDDEQEEPEGKGEESDEDLNDMESVPLDPRAGKVDVVLPQLKISYADLAKKLLETGGQKNVKPKNRKMLYNLARKFKEVDAGSYPLAVDIEVPTGPVLSRKDVDAAAQRLIALEESMTDHTRKNRQPKKIRKRLAKQLQQQEAQASLNESSSSEATNSIYLHDDDLLDHADDNYMSYLEELHQNGGNTPENDEDDESDSPDEDQHDFANGLESSDKSFSMLNIENGEEENNGESSGSPKKVSKNNRKYKTVIEVEADEVDGQTSAAVLNETTQPKKRRSTRPEIAENGNGVKTKTTASQAKLRRSSIMRTPIPDDFDDSDPNSDNDSGEDTVITLSNSKFRKRKLNDTISRGMKLGTPSNIMSPATPGSMSTKRKRVSFVLARNLEHQHSDYKESINRSPAIPYDSGKRPNYGLLKTANSPASPSPSLSLQLANTPRRRTNRF